MEDTVKEPETAPVAAAPKKRGWPKGKPRKVVGKVVTPVLDAAGKLQDLETKPIKRRRRRRNVAGVTVGKDFYPGVTARWEDNGNFLKVVSDGSEVWIPVDRTKPIKVKGFSLPPLVRYGSGITYTYNTAGTDTGSTPYTQTTYTAASLQASNQASGPRVVVPGDHVNLAPERESYVRRVAASRNNELDNLMRQPLELALEEE